MSAATRFGSTLDFDLTAVRGPMARFIKHFSATTGIEVGAVDLVHSAVKWRAPVVSNFVHILQINQYLEKNIGTQCSQMESNLLQQFRAHFENRAFEN